MFQEDSFASEIINIGLDQIYLLSNIGANLSPAILGEQGINL